MYDIDIYMEHEREVTIDSYMLLRILASYLVTHQRCHLPERFFAMVRQCQRYYASFPLTCDEMEFHFRLLDKLSHKEGFGNAAAMNDVRTALVLFNKIS